MGCGRGGAVGGGTGAAAGTVPNHRCDKLSLDKWRFMGYIIV
jgi:hypothetical protein